MKIVERLSYVVLALALAGCAPTPYELYKAGKPVPNFPYRAGATVGDKDQDTTNCEVEAAQRVPQQIEVHTTPVYTTPVQTYCYRSGYQTICNSTGGDTYGGDMYSTDANAGLRKRVEDQCMARKGWRWIDLPACPAGVQATDLRGVGAHLPQLTNATCYIAYENGASIVGNRAR